MASCGLFDCTTWNRGSARESPRVPLKGRLRVAVKGRSRRPRLALRSWGFLSTEFGSPLN